MTHATIHAFLRNKHFINSRVEDRGRSLSREESVWERGREVGGGVRTKVFPNYLVSACEGNAPEEGWPSEAEQARERAGRVGVLRKAWVNFPRTLLFICSREEVERCAPSLFHSLCFRTDK